MPRIRPVALSLAILSILVFSTFSFAVSSDRIKGSINTGQTVRLGARVPLQARPKFDQGPVDPFLNMSYITLMTVPSDAQQKALQTLLAEQQNPHSASYHKWLTVGQYADQFGLSPNDIDKLTAWLKSQGFSIVRTANGRNWIAFGGTAAQVERTFQVKIHSFKVDGDLRFSNINSPSIPSALSGIVVGFRGLNDFRPKSQARRAPPGYTYPANGGEYLFLAPGDIKTMYDINTLYTNGIDGSNQVLGIVGQTGIYQSDLTNFRQNFGLSAINCGSGVSGDIIKSCNTSNFRYALVEGNATTISLNDLPEADIDLEWSGATARNAQIVYFNAPSGGGVWDAWYFAVDNESTYGESVISMSYTAPCELAEAGPGTGEFTFTGDEAQLAMANSLGITFMNSSGDNGASACDYGGYYAEYGYAVSYPASSQYVTGVGGTLIPYTEFTQTYFGGTNGSDGGSALSYVPEQPWNDSLEFAYYCEANPSDSFCSGNGVGAGPPDADWANMQENVIGISASGGGVSNCASVDGNGVCNGGFPQPSWQVGLDTNAINPSGFGQANSTPARFVPDVSLLASASWPGYLVCTHLSALGGTGSGSSCDSPTTGIADMLNACLVTGTEPCSIFGGTSVSSPIFGGMVALLNQDVVAKGIQPTPGLGNINPTLYSLAAANSTNGAFNPITTSSSGSYSNGAWCDPGQPVTGITGDPWPAAMQCPSTGTNLLGFNSYNFDPTTNYNLTVGLGSVNISHLAAAITAAGATTTTTVSSSKNPSNFGDSVTFTATVTTSGPDTPTGTVTFMDGSMTLGTGPLGCICDGVVNSATATYTTTPTQLPAGSDSITAVYGGDQNNAGSTSAPPLMQVVNPATFTFVSTGSASHTVLAGQASLTYTFTATPTSGSTFVSAVNILCSFTPADPTLTGNVCSYSVNGGATQTGSAVIPAGSGTSTVTVTIKTAGPNSGTGTQFRHRSDNRLPWLPMALPLAGVVLARLAGRKRSKYSVVASLFLALVLAGFLIACGSSNNPPPAVTVSVSPSGSTLFANDSADGWPPQTASFTATVMNSTNTAVTWSLSSSVSCTSNPSPCGTIDSTGAYTAPTIVAGLPGSITVTATSQADTTKSGTASITLTPTTVPVNGGYTVTVSASETGASTSPTPSVTLVVN